MFYFYFFELPKEPGESWLDLSLISITAKCSLFLIIAITGAVNVQDFFIQVQEYSNRLCNDIISVHFTANKALLCTDTLVVLCNTAVIPVLLSCADNM